MEKRNYKVVLTEDVNNEFIKGRISGIIAAITGNWKSGKSHAIMVYETSAFFCYETTEDQHNQIKEIIRSNYPGKCLFVSEVIDI